MKKQLFTLITLLTVFNFSTLAGECSFQRPSVDINDSIIENLNLAEVAVSQFSRQDNLYINGESGIHPEDKRVQKTAKSPKFLDAVGRLEMKFANGKTTSCTANLTDTVPGRASRVLTTNRHCVFDKKTGEAPTSIKWTTKLQDGSTITKVVKVEMQDETTDVALLSFETAIPFSKIQPLLLEAEMMLSPTDIGYYSKNIVAAGYSSDKEIGKNGTVLTYTDGLQSQTLRNGANRSIGINTFSFGGASGGALIADADLSDEDIENPHGQKYILGTLIGGSSAASVRYKSSNGAEGSNANLFSSYENFFKHDGEGIFNQLN
ncbi:trypsin-like peptidase domain protein [Bacteriovorax sp. BSW11_IV]|uniref:trypsin-like peptidase domain-containing protein n=1 Tax=Bacteriovorax sp. BSW11_IV TaxID=1353529 RepID=UPI000389F3A2|nr:trypsin-like peptidase domain-containing protein [Bacteriovorax sp. BSW11_IV]EQC45736.1 trypsin-like peptidase domain protein [Bacteriovorax sp. BSW11_IV]